MCGIVGFLAPKDGWRAAGARSVLTSMSSRLTHRGPDAEGEWTDVECGIGFGHRRLSIIDLSLAGAQPMLSHDGRYVISYNGEIYNFEALRAEVEVRHGGFPWRGHSDTEVLCELISTLGLRETLPLLDGMFAFGLWDRQQRKLTLARDPFGEKPLYYGRCGRALVFASELKALFAYPGFHPEIDRSAIADFFKYSYVPAPRTIYEGVFKLPPGQFVEIAVAADGGLRLDHGVYWSAAAAVEAALADPFEGSEREAEDLVENIARALVRRRMVADVPIGCLLSGGIDSSFVAALMQANATSPIKTFSIGMAEEGFDEVGFAQGVASAIGTDHTALTLEPATVQDTVPAMPEIYDEPFGDISQIPTFLVSRLARESVKVALSGDGGDELFGGYNRYFHGARLWTHLSACPRSLRAMAAAAIQALPASFVHNLSSCLKPVLPQELSAGRAPEKLQKFVRVLPANDAESFLDQLLAAPQKEVSLLGIDGRAANLTERIAPALAGLPFAERAMCLDICTYLPDDILTKVDRASMAVSLELRTPFLNTELFSLAWRLPSTVKIQGSVGKRIIRNILYRHVPRSLVDRPKSGFTVPLGRWLRSGLRDWAEAQLGADKLRDCGIFDVGAVRQLWSEHLTGQRDHEALLWNVLMFQGWSDRYARSPGPRTAGATPPNAAYTVSAGTLHGGA